MSEKMETYEAFVAMIARSVDKHISRPGDLCPEDLAWEERNLAERIAYYLRAAGYNIPKETAQ